MTFEVAFPFEIEIGSGIKDRHGQVHRQRYVGRVEIETAGLGGDGRAVRRGLVPDVIEGLEVEVDFSCAPDAPEGDDQSQAWTPERVAQAIAKRVGAVEDLKWNRIVVWLEEGSARVFGYRCQPWDLLPEKPAEQD